MTTGQYRIARDGLLEKSDLEQGAGRERERERERDGRETQRERERETAALRKTKASSNKDDSRKKAEARKNTCACVCVWKQNKCMAWLSITCRHGTVSHCLLRKIIIEDDLTQGFVPLLLIFC